MITKHFYNRLKELVLSASTLLAAIMLWNDGILIPSIVLYAIAKHHYWSATSLYFVP